MRQAKRDGRFQFVSPFEHFQIEAKEHHLLSASPMAEEGLSGTNIELVLRPVSTFHGIVVDDAGGAVAAMAVRVNENEVDAEGEFGDSWGWTVRTDREGRFAVERHAPDSSELTLLFDDPGYLEVSRTFRDPTAGSKRRPETFVVERVTDGVTISARTNVEPPEGCVARLYRQALTEDHVHIEVGSHTVAKEGAIRFTLAAEDADGGRYRILLVDWGWPIGLSDWLSPDDPPAEIAIDRNEMREVAVAADAPTFLNRAKISIEGIDDLRFEYGAQLRVHLKQRPDGSRWSSFGILEGAHAVAHVTTSTGPRGAYGPDEPVTPTGSTTWLSTYPLAALEVSVRSYASEQQAELLVGVLPSAGTGPNFYSRTTDGIARLENMPVGPVHLTLTRNDPVEGIVLVDSRTVELTRGEQLVEMQPR